MWHLGKRARIFLAIGATDLRKSIDGLAILVDQQMDGNLFSGDLFAFCNQRRTTIKILYYDRNVFCLWQKRLESRRLLSRNQNSESGA